MAIVIVTLWLLFLGCVSAQVEGEFPQPAAVSLYKPVVASSTCGELQAEAFCEYTDDADSSLSPNCMGAVCDDMCLFADSSPSPVDLTSIGTQGGGVTSSLMSGPGGTAVLEFTDSFISIPSSSAPQISSDGFTFAVWMKQDESNDGYLVIFV